MTQSPACTSSVDAALTKTFRLQRDAADPRSSVWVSANAGTGKTHVLTNRVLRLLLAGTPPERILCLTYTKAAAAEMSKRIFDRLAEWVMADETDLRASLSELCGREPAQPELDAARTLFTSAIETPGGLKVQTIHAFCERLLQRFPLEAGIAPDFTILDDSNAQHLLREAIDAVLVRATASPESPLGRALTAAVAYAGDLQFDEILKSALRHRGSLDAIMRDPNRTETASPTAATDLLRHHLQISQTATWQQLTSEMASVLTTTQLHHLREVLESGSSTDRKHAAAVNAALYAANDAIRAAALNSYLLTGNGTLRARPLTRELQTAHPGLHETISEAQSRFAVLSTQRLALETVEATLALYRITDDVSQCYKAAKNRRSALDFEDLIEKSVKLLSDRSATQWILYKLDEGLSHILVDESQDTSPDQWKLIAALAEEFFSGEGAHEERRTLFAVGDEKQSIYSFQGARPEEFACQGDRFKRLADQSGRRWQNVPLNLSFRSVQPVLSAVDRIFADTARTPGVRSHIKHIARRAGHAGLIELWPAEKWDAAADSDPWTPLEDESQAAPEFRLADRIAGTIAAWLDNKEPLASTGQPTQPGDILILVRNRKPFAAPMVAALKKRGIAVAGADRIKLVDQIAVQDLLSLGDFLTLPEDDLALAEILKSPIFDFDDDDLLTIAESRNGTLWRALLAKAKTTSRYREAADTLKRWRKLADFAPPYEFFARLLDKDGVRKKMIARLGPDAADPIDEFINLALAYDDHAPPSLTGFLYWIRDGQREIKRDMEHGRNEVRVMTVHGAKGLEAPIVFLPDTCTSPSGAGKNETVITVPAMERPLDTPPPFVWAIKRALHVPAVRAAKDAVAERDAEESHRLLYVAMTRARDRLYIAGFEGKTQRPDNCWYNLAEDALSGLLDVVDEGNGRTIWRSHTPQSAEFEKPKFDYSGDQEKAALPVWATRTAPHEPRLAVPFAPSRLVPCEIDDDGEPLAMQPAIGDTSRPPAMPPSERLRLDRFLRGNLTHALLEHLPQFEPHRREAVARHFIDQRGGGLTPEQRTGIVKETLAILDYAEFAPLFGVNSSAEVPIVALIPRPRGSGPPLRLTGEIDRLVDTGEEILIVDYKTNRPPPETVDGVANAYLYQLASYRLAVAQIYPAKRVRAALLWTEGPRIMEISPDILDRYESTLWDLDAASP